MSALYAFVAAALFCQSVTPRDDGSVDIGGIAGFLASPAAAFITGQCIVADGGVTIL